MTTANKKLKKRAAPEEEEASSRDGRVLPTLKYLHPSTGKEMEVDYSRDVRIGPDLERELRELPSRMAWFASIRDGAADALRASQHEEYCTEEDLYLEIKTQLEDLGSKVTETEVKNRVKAHPRMRTAYRAQMAAKERARHAESVFQLLVEKRWILVSLVKYKAAEMGSGLSDA